ncbi:MAG TPA: N-acetylmuramoyl-L-alanine amidase [Bacillota bacterium]
MVGMRFFTASTFLLLCLFIFASVSYAEHSRTYEVHASQLHVRDAPDYDATIIGNLQTGDKVVIFQEEYGWAKTYYHGKEAWIAFQYVQPVSQEEHAPSTHQDQIVITGSNVHIRSGPSMDDHIIDSASKGDMFEVIDAKEGWKKVVLRTDEHGWIAEQFTSKPSPSEQTSQLIIRPKEGTTVQTSPQSLEKYTIVIDPGHGGKDPGAIGLDDVAEKDVILSTSEVVAEHLREAGATVILTRTGDEFLSLEERIRVSNSHHTDAFISIHYNAFPILTVRGMSTYYYDGGNDEQLAQHIHSSLIEAINLPDRGIQQADYKVLRENRDLAILIELGFITNPDDFSAIHTPDYKDQVGEAIVNGLINYFHQP